MNAKRTLVSRIDKGMLLLTVIAGFMLMSLVKTAGATDCPGATVVPASPVMPYVITLSCGTTDDINYSNASVCGNDYYMDGWEVLYVWTPAVDYSNVTFAYSGQTWTGIFLWEGCPTSGGTCIGNYTSSGSSKTLAYVGDNMTSGTTISVTAGHTYYIMVDTYPAPDSPCPGTLTINGSDLVPCSGTPAPGNTLASVNPVFGGANFTLSLQNPTTGTGVTYQWQSSPDGLSWTNVGTSTPTYITNQITATYYQCIVTCSGNSGTSTPVQVTMSAGYCPSAAGGTSFEYIGGVVATGGINNTGTAHTTYSDFTAFSSSVGVGDPMTVVVSSGGTWYSSDRVYIFIDWNQNGSLSDPGELVGTANGSVSPYTVNFSVPVTALPGSTRMRVKFGDETGTIPFNNDPCQVGFTYGEVEDYTIIVTAVSCLPPTAVSLVPDADSCTFSWTSSASVFQFQIGPQGFSHSSEPMYITSSNPFTANAIPDGCYDFYVRAICAPGDTSAWSSVESFCICTGGIQYIPFVETFTSPNFPPCGWDTLMTNTVDPTTTWHYALDLGNGIAQVLFDYDQDEWLITPHFDLSSNSMPFLKFDWRASKYWMVYPYDNYDLNIYARVNSGAWVEIWDEYMSDTASMGAFVWQTDSVSLATYAGQADVQFAFQYVGDDGAQLDLDNITLYEPPVIDLAVHMGDVHECDTFGLVPVPIALYNEGTVTIPATTTVTATYQLNADPAVVETLTIPVDLNPGDSVMVMFSTPVLLNQFTTYNAMMAVSLVGDMVNTNDTTVFTLTFHGYPVVDLGADTMICGPSTINLDAGNPGASYSWWNGSTTQIHPVNVTYCAYGSDCDYWVDVTYTYGTRTCTSRDTINIEFNSIPVVDLGNDTALCTGESLYLDAGAGYASYLWSTGHSTQDLTVDTTATYSVTVTSIEGCEGSGDINVNVQSVYDATITTATLVYCDNEPIFNLTAVDAGGVWSGNGVVNTSTGLYSPAAALIGLNEVIYAIPGSCGDADTVDIEIKKTIQPYLGPDTTLCADQSIMLDAGAHAGVTYLWWDGGSAQTATFDTSDMPGMMTAVYWVEIDTNGCAARDSITVTWDLCTGMNENGNIAMRIYPNPSTGVFTIDFGGLKGLTLSQVMDLNGRVVIAESLELNGTETHILDLGGYANGIYSIRMINGQDVKIVKVVKK